ncbi:MAG TPA: YdcF family protein [Rhizomicrobium sp.]
MEGSGSVLLKFVGVVAIAYVAGFLLFAATLPGTPATIPPADGIVALTGGGARVDAADALLESGAGKRLLISGVNPGTTKAQLKALVHSGRRFDCCADLGFQAADTHGNASEAAGWARMHDYHSLIVVTANYHIRRSMAEFAADMPGMRLEAYPVSPEGIDLTQWWRDPHALRLMHSEYAKYLASLVITMVDHKA